MEQAFSTSASINNTWIEFLASEHTHAVTGEGHGKNRALFFPFHQSCERSSPQRSHFESVGSPSPYFYLSGRDNVLSKQLARHRCFKHRLIPRREECTLHGDTHRTITLPDGLMLNRNNFAHDVCKVLKYVTASANKTSPSSLLRLRKRFVPTSPYFSLYVFSILIRAADCLQT